MADNLTPKEEFLLNPVTEYNIIDAAIATFETNFRHPVKVEISFGPKQDLHGMPNPYPAGASVNLIPDGMDTENGYVAGQYLNADGTTTANTNWYISEYFEINSEVTYTWSNTYITTTPSICFYDSNKEFISGIKCDQQLSHTFTPPSGAVYARSSQTTYALQESTTLNNGSRIQLEVGSTATEYRRYSNICPIDGFTGVTINRCGKNLFPNYNGENSTFYLPKGTKFVASNKCVNGGGYIRWRYADGVQDSLKWINEGASSDGLSHYRRFGATNKDIASAFFFLSGRTLSECQIEIGSQFTAYEPFNKTVLPIAFTDPSTGDPLTVYGGTLTLNEDGSADLLAKYKYRRLTASRWGDISGNYIRAYNYLGPQQSGNQTRNLYCNVLKAYTKTNSYVNEEYSISTDNGLGKVCLYITLSQTASEEGITTKSQALSYVNNWLSKNEVYICYSLVTPTTYHFPNIGQLKTFLGVNNIWSDVGNVNVKYLTQNSETGMEYRGDRALELRRRAMLADAPTIHTTVGSEATGGLASFKSYIKAPVKKIEIPFKPVQDLHGMDYPYPAGGSVNLIPDTTDASNGYVAGQYLNADGTTTANTNWYISEYITLDPETTYTWSNRVNTSVSPSICFYDENKEFISGININKQYAYTFTPPEGTVYCRSSQSKYTYQTSTDSPAFQLEVGETATPYQRYSNICPIEGFDSTEIVNSQSPVRTYTIMPTQEGTGTPSPTNVRPIHPGLVLERDDGTTLTIYGGTLTVNGDGTSILIKDRLTYTYDGVNYKANGSSYLRGDWIRAGIIYAPGSPASSNTRPIYCDRLKYYNGTGVGGGEYSLACVDSGALYFVVQLTEDAAEKGITTAAEANAYVNNWFKENPTTISYKTNKTTTYNLSVTETIRALAALEIKLHVVPITFTDPSTGDPLTVYGGTVTLNEDGSADLVGRVGAYVITGNETWTKRSDTVYRLQNRNTGVGIYKVGNSKCNYFKTTTGYDPTDGSFSISTGGDMTYVSFCAPSFLGTSTTACQAKAKELYDNGTPIIFCSNLRSPITYHFPTVGQLRIWLGENNFWCDISDDITVKYLNRGFGN